jgi:octaprenyl-diphosphate synthase
MQLKVRTDISGPFNIISKQLCQVKHLINKQLSDTDVAVRDMFKSIDVGGGKMLRPAMLLLSAAACGKITDSHILAAAIVEMIHNATLLHDDVIDDGRQRRGRPTVNSLKGNESAVLMGDFLLSKVFQMCMDLAPEVRDAIADAAAKTCEGELRQIANRRNWQMSESDYIDIISQKSAALFSSCCRLGAVLAAADRRHIKVFSDFGLNFGVAFQISDDILDITGDEDRTGKTLGRDFDKNKLTLPLIHLIKMIGNRGSKAIAEMLSADVGDRSDLKAMLISNGSLEYTANRCREFVEKAVTALNGLKENKAKTVLIETARFLADRDR